MSERTALRLGALLALVWAAAALAAVHPEAIGLFHDDGIYLATAKALAEGDGYRQVNLPGEPFQTKYPPLWPALLAVVWKLAPAFPANVPVFKALGIALWALVLPATQRLATRAAGLSPGAGLAVAALLASSPILFVSTNFALSEPLFALLATLALLPLAERPGREITTAGALGGGALAALGLLTRTQGLGLLMAIALACALARGPRRHWLAVAPGLAAGSGWWLWVGTHPATPSSALLEPYLSYRAFAAGAGAGSLVAYGRERAGAVARGLGELLGGGSGSLALAAGLLLLAAAAAGIFTMARSGRRLLAAYALFALLLAAAAPWPPRRLLLPALGPLLVLAAAGVVPAAGGTAHRRWRALLGGGAAAALALGGAARLASEVSARDVASVPVASALSSGRGDWHGYRETASWLAGHVPSREVIGSAHDPFYFLYSGRRGVRFWISAPGEQLVARLEGRGPALGEPGELLAEYRRLGVRWLLLERVGATSAALGPEAFALGTRIVARPEAGARRAFRSSDGEHEVWELGADAGAAAEAVETARR